MEESTRRRFLQAAGATGLAGLTGTSGCIGYMEMSRQQDPDEASGVLARQDYENPRETDFSPYDAVEARVEDLEVFGDQYRASNDDADLIDVITVGTAVPQGAGVRTFAHGDLELLGDGYDYNKEDVREHRVGSPAGDAAVTAVETGEDTPVTDLVYSDGIDESTVFRLRGPVRIMAQGPDRNDLDYVLEVDAADPGVTVPASWYPDA